MLVVIPMHFCHIIRGRAVRVWRQWLCRCVVSQDELEKHVDAHVQLQVFTYYGQSRTANIKQLAENDIVLTTYQTLASDSKVCLVMLLLFLLSVL